MRAVIQRTSSSSVRVDGQTIASIQQGLLILLGIGPNDHHGNVQQMARKIAMLRIFGDDQDKMNLSVLDVGGSAIVVSQFTLYADTRKGNRPAFTDAALPEVASPLVERFVEHMRMLGVPTQTGEFGAHMQVELVNDGPVTILLEM